MMLAVVALATWLAASVASAMPVHAIRSAHDTWNETNTPISSFNASMNSNYTNTSEERVGPQTDIQTILANLHENMFPKLSSETRQAKIAALNDKIKDIENGFNGIFLATPHDQFYKSEQFLNWVEHVKNIYDGILEGATERVIFNILAYDSKGDRRTMFKALAEIKKNEGTKKIAENLLTKRYKKWKEDATLDFKNKRLDEITTPIFESLQYVKWKKSVFLGCSSKEESDMARSVLHHVMIYNCKGDNLIRALAAATKCNRVAGFANARLDRELRKLEKANVSEAEIFNLLQLNPKEGRTKLEERPLYKKWKQFVTDRYKQDAEKAQKMINLTLQSHGLSRA